MNAHLVCASGFQTALHKSVAAKVLNNVHLGHGTLALPRLRGAAPAAVAAIVNQFGFNTSRLRPAAHERQILSLNSVSAKLLAEMALGLGCARKNDEAARLLVKPMHGPDTFPFALTAAGQEARQQIRQRRWQIAAGTGAELRSLLRMANGREPGRLIDPHNLFVA